MSIERCFLTNQLFDFFLLAAVSRGMGRFSLRRIALAACLSALYALPATALGWARAPALQLLLLVPLSALTAGQLRFEAYTLAGLGLITAVSVAGMAAVVTVMPPILKGLMCACVGAAFVIALLTKRRRFHTGQWLNVCISHRGKQVQLCALLDTGNRLTEPLSGLPVLIAQAYSISKLVPRSAERLVAYGGIGGGGVLECFLPDALTVSDGSRREPVHAWVAACPEPLPCGIQALAPATFAVY